MKTVVFPLIALLASTPALAQTAPQARSATGSDLTRSLNGAPPAVVAAQPSTSVPPRNPTAAPIPVAPSSTVPRAVPITPPLTESTPRSAPITPSAAAPRTTITGPVTRTGPTNTPTRSIPNATSTTPVPPPSTATAPASAPRAAESTLNAASPVSASAPLAVTAAPAAPISPAPTPPTVLNPAAITALPFTLTLPTGFQITTGRPGPDFRVYTIRRGNQPFVMFYTGPTSQFPIYSGEVVQAAGRASVVTVDGNQRRAVEHLFQRPTAPGEVHVWVSSLDGADRTMAEQIAQSVDVR